MDAQIDMITDLYAHIWDEDRKINAQKFEDAFYAGLDLKNVKPPEYEKANSEFSSLNMKKGREFAKWLQNTLNHPTSNSFHRKFGCEKRFKRV